jgi:hypothetical protein
MRRSLLFSTATLVSSLGLGCTDGPAPTDPSAPAATEPASLTRAAAPLAPTTQLLVTGLQELQGSTVGPGGALFVTARAALATPAPMPLPAPVINHTFPMLHLLSALAQGSYCYVGETCKVQQLSPFTAACPA